MAKRRMQLALTESKLNNLTVDPNVLVAFVDGTKPMIAVGNNDSTVLRIADEK